MRPTMSTLVLFAFPFSFFLFPLALPGQGPEETFRQHNVMIVLDASGSMGEKMSGSNVRKIDAAKKALVEVLKQVPPDTHIGLLIFSAQNLRNDYVYPLGPRDDERLRQAIMQPQPGNGTPLGAYIKKGADRLLEQRAKQRGYGTYRLLIVTDGESTDRLVDPYLPDVLARGILVDVIGVNMKANHTLATKVHSYRRADDPATLQRAVAEVFAEVSDKGAGVADEQALAAIAALPTDMAAAMLQALADSGTGNQPIGTKPTAPPGAAAPQPAGPVRTPAPPVQAPRVTPAPARPQAPPARGPSVPVILLITLGIVVVAVVVLALRLARAGGGGSGPGRRYRRP